MTVSKESLHGEVLDQLGLLVTGGGLEPGHTVLTEELVARFGVSRTVVREAVRVLESMGLVTSRRRVGVTVAPREHWQVHDPRVIRWRLDGPDREEQLRTLTELRGGVEPVAARLAATHATPRQCGELARAVMDMAVHGRSGELGPYLEADVRFHSTLLAASGNEMLAAFSGMVAEVLAGRTRHDLMPSRPKPAAIRLHADVAEAVQAGDQAAAEAAMRGILAEVDEAMQHAAE